jgi:hypothetical protein
MKIYLSSKGLLVIEDGASYKSFEHDDGSPFRIEKAGNYITVRQLSEKIAGPALYTSIFQSDGVTPAGASAAATVTYIENLLTTSES